MVKNNFRSVLLSLLSHKTQAFISMTSLGISLTVFGFALLYVKHEIEYDRSWPHADRIHRLLVEQRELPQRSNGIFHTVMSGAYGAIGEYFDPYISASTRIFSSFVRPKESDAADLQEIHFVDSSFADVFQFKGVVGDLSRALSAPGFIALEATYAKSVAGNPSLGDRIVLVNPAGSEIQYEVAAIFELPKNISEQVRFTQITLANDYSLPLFRVTNRSPWEGQAQIWIKLQPGVDLFDFNSLQPGFVDQTVDMFDQFLLPGRNITDHLIYRWQPITALHFDPSDSERTVTTGSASRIFGFAIVGILVLLVGCSNFTSLCFARALERRHEMGVRKAAGASPQDIMFICLAEAVVLSFVATLVVIAVMKMLLPIFIKLLPYVSSIETGFFDFALLFFISTTVGLANGLWPALFLSSIKPQVALKPGSTNNSAAGLRGRNFIVACQFAFASMLLIGTTAIYLQLEATRSQPLGFDAKNLVVILLKGGQQQASIVAFRNELEKLPEVIQAVPAFTLINSYVPPNRYKLVKSMSDRMPINFGWITVDGAFFQIMNIPLLAGRTYVESDSEESNRIVVNRATIAALGFATADDAIDQEVFLEESTDSGTEKHTRVRIIGVVEDHMYTSLRRRPEPEAYNLARSPAPLLIVRYAHGATDSVQSRILEAAATVGGNPISDLIYAKPFVDGAYQREQSESTLMQICGIVAIVLASTGLYGLAAFSTQVAIKEVGIRKTMGASTIGIVGMFLVRFSRIVMLASLASWLPAIYFVLKWIEQFPYQLDRSWLIASCFVVTSAVLLLSILTVSAITWRAASLEPSKTLRYE